MTDNERQGVFACTQSRRHSANDDRADELPEGSLDDDRDHVHHSHGHILCGQRVGNADSTDWTCGV